MQLTPIFNIYGVAVLFSVFGLPASGQSYDVMEHPLAAYFSNDIDPRIVNGRPARVGEAYYQLAIYVNDYYHCGATLVESPKNPLQQLVITAAHCVLKGDRKTPWPINRIYFLGGVISLDDDGAQLRDPVKVIYHEGFFIGNDYDIAVATLNRPFDISETLRPIKLPANEFADEDAWRVTVSGWGRLAHEGARPETLQIINLPVISEDVCNAWYRKIFMGHDVIHEASFCAGYEAGGRDACSGDSGGPAVAKLKDGPILMGVVSWGIECARENWPGVYTRVSQYLDWIAEHT